MINIQYLSRFIAIEVAELLLQDVHILPKQLCNEKNYRRDRWYTHRPLIAVRFAVILLVDYEFVQNFIHSRFIPEEVADTSQIFLRNAQVTMRNAERDWWLKLER
jgi:hypothetical protein